MSVFDDNKKNKSKKQYFGITSVNDTSVEQEPKSLEELKKAGRGEARNNKAQKPKKTGFWVYLNEEQKENLQARAKKANLSMSKYIMVKIFGVD